MAYCIARPRRFLLLGIVVVLFSCALPGCTPPPDDGGGAGAAAGAGTGPGGRAQALALTPEQEVKLGNEAFQEVLSHSTVVKDPGDEVKKTAEKIFKVALTNDPLQREINLHVKGWNWDDRKYAVVKKDQVNAFCLPAGKVVVFTGLLKMTAGHPDWLATVLGHEIAHALAHHSSERIARERMYRPAMNAFGLGLDELGSDDRAKLVSLLGAGSAALDFQPQSQGDHVGIFQQIRELSYDRQQESEADHIGIFLMTFAGYDPRQGVAFWEAMSERSGGGGKPEILSDHPSDAHRVAQMKVWAVRAHDALMAWNAGKIEPARGK